MVLKRLMWVLVPFAGFALIFAAYAQQQKPASPSDAVAQSLVAMERDWAEAACTHKLVVETILADDFQGTAPDGKRYSKAEAIEEDKSSKIEARDCRLLDAKVHFFGDSTAIIYGSESSVRKSSDGKEFTRTLVWTDTWLKRKGKWQIVSAQDTRTDGCK